MTFIPCFKSYSQHDKNGEFAQLVQQKLDAYKADDPQMGEVCLIMLYLQREKMDVYNWTHFYTILGSTQRPKPANHSRPRF